MDIFIARQPIFDQELNTIAYELLYRNNTNNSASLDGDCATSNVLINGLLMMSLDTISNKKKVFVKFTHNFIHSEIATLFHPKILTIEVMEDFESDPTIVEALQKLKVKGYSIALDEYSFSDTIGNILTLTDIIKIDFKVADKITITEIANTYKDTKIKLLAEKVETKEDFEFAKKLGFHYFQGYFFEVPIITSSKDVQSIHTTHLKVLKELNNEYPDYGNIALIIESDMGLVYQLLKLVNSVAYSGSFQITSIKQALVKLGIKELTKWMTLIMFKELSKTCIEELVKTSILRARVMETISEHLDERKHKTEFFIVGMFSLIDTIMQRPKEDILIELDLGDRITDALRGNDNIMRQSLDFIIAVEKGQWKKTEEFDGPFQNLTIESVFIAINEARRWLKSMHEEI